MSETKNETVKKTTKATKADTTEISQEQSVAQEQSKKTTKTKEAQNTGKEAIVIKTMKLNAGGELSFALLKEPYGAGSEPVASLVESFGADSWKLHIPISQIKEAAKALKQVKKAAKALKKSDKKEKLSKKEKKAAKEAKIADKLAKAAKYARPAKQN